MSVGAALQVRRIRILTDTADQLTENNNVGTPGSVFLQRRPFEQALGSKIGGTDVGIKAKLLSELEDTLLGTDRTNTPFGTTDGTFSCCLAFNPD